MHKIPVPLIIWVASYIFFLLTLANNFSASHDSINYLYHITKGEHLFHQHHLLYHFLANKWLWLWKGIFNGGDHYLIESFTALWGAGVLTLVYLFFRNRFYLTLTASVVGVSVVAFSYGAWFYSTNIEVYMPSIFFICWCLYILTGKGFNKSDVWKIAVLHSIAILFHQVNILFTVVVLFWFFSHKIYRPVLQYALIGVCITGSCYFITGWFFEGHNDWKSWVSWMRGYTVGHEYWRPLSPKTPLYVLTGFTHAIIGGHFVFQLPAVEACFQHSFQSHGLQDEIYLSSKISPATAWLLAGLTMVFGVIFLILIIKFISGIRSRKTTHHITMPLILCIFVYAAFFCFWMPEILEFWILQMILLWILLIGTLREHKIIFAIPVLLFCINFFGSIRWMQDIDNDWYYIETKKIAKTTRPGQTLKVKDWIMEDYLRYFTGSKVIRSNDKR